MIFFIWVVALKYTENLKYHYQKLGVIFKDTKRDAITCVGKF